MTLRLTAAALALLCGAAQAQLIVPVSQERWVEAYVEECYSSATLREEATTFDLFDEGVVSDDYYYVSTASASQSSVILGDTIACSGSGAGLANGFCSGCYDGVGRSMFRVEFDLVQEASYSFEGGTGGWSYGGGTIQLKDVDNGVVLLSSVSGYNQVDSFHVNGTLPAGRYELLQDVGGGAGACFPDYEGGSGNAGFTFTAAPLGESYCVASANSTGSGAALAYSGSQDRGANDFTLEASGLPAGVSGLFFFGPTQIQVPFGDGFRCVGGPTRRVQPAAQADGAGDLTRALDFGVGAGSAITSGTPWNFQLWYRDPMGPGGSGFNTSDGLNVVFHD